MKFRINYPLRVIITFVLTAGSLSAPAEDSGPKGLRLPNLPTLVFLPPHLEGTNPPTWAKEFETALIQDLTHSQAFRLLGPAKPGTGPDDPTFRHWREAGADLLLRTLHRPASRGKIMLEGECVALGVQSVLMKKLFVGELKAVHRMAHRLADLLVGRVTGIPGCADSTLVFVHQKAPGIKEIYGLDRDGRNLRQLTNFGSLTAYPALSPDGKLALVTYKGGPPEIWGQTQARGPLKRLHPRDHGAGLGISDLAWAPDGKRLAFVQNDRKGDSAIFLLDPMSQKTTRLEVGGHICRGPSWSPDGTQIAFLSDRAGSLQVFVMGSDGTRVRQVTTDPSPKTCVAWSPVEDRLACIGRDDGWYDLNTLTSSGTAKKKVRLGAFPAEGISWAPDGRWLAMGLKLGQETQVRIVDLDGATQAIPGCPAGSQFPQWIRNHPSPDEGAHQADQNAKDMVNSHDGGSGVDTFSPPSRQGTGQRYGDVARDHAAIRDGAMALFKALRDAPPHSIEVFLKGQQSAPNWFRTLGYRDLDPWEEYGGLRPTTPFLDRLEAMANLSNSININFRGLERPGPVSYTVDNGAFAQGWLTLEARKILMMAGKRHGCAKEGPVTQLVRAIWRVATGHSGNCTWAPRVVAALAPWLKSYLALFQEWERLYPALLEGNQEHREHGEALCPQMEELHSAWLSGKYLRGVKS